MTGKQRQSKRDQHISKHPLNCRLQVGNRRLQKNKKKYTKMSLNGTCMHGIGVCMNVKIVERLYITIYHTSLNANVLYS